MFIFGCQILPISIKHSFKKLSTFLLFHTGIVLRKQPLPLMETVSVLPAMNNCQIKLHSCVRKFAKTITSWGFIELPLRAALLNYIHQLQTLAFGRGRRNSVNKSPVIKVSCIDVDSISNQGTNRQNTSVLWLVIFHMVWNTVCSGSKLFSNPWTFKQTFAQYSIGYVVTYSPIKLVLNINITYTL